MTEGIEPAMLQQLVADVASLKASQAAGDRERASMARDVREARDAALETRAVLKELDFSAQLERMQAAHDREMAALRQDLVHAVNGINTRLSPLEAARQQVTGMGALLKALKDYGGWAVGLSAVALHFFDKGGLR